jgi:hypothetical protein
MLVGGVSEGYSTIARRLNAGEARKRALVPKGRLRRVLVFSRPFGTDWLYCTGHPALKRRAILGCPFGTEAKPAPVTCGLHLRLAFRANVTSDILAIMCVSVCHCS